jgi:Ca2+-binding RTX toxin-like protein
MSRRRSATLAAVATVGAMLVPVSAAGAATIAVVDGTAVFSAAPGEANDVVAGDRANSDPLGRTLKVTDAGATLTAGAGCQQIDAHSAWCEEPLGEPLPLLVRAGDRSDRVVVDDFFARTLTLRGESGNDDLHAGSSTGSSALLDGGSGDDTLFTAMNAGGSPVLRGGSGNDQLTLHEGGAGQAFGGDGDDRIVYDEIPGPFAVRLAGDAGNDVYTFGPVVAPAVLQPGPGIDTLDQSTARFGLDFNFADCPGCVEVVLGTPLADTITGDRNPQAIFGGAGDDQLDGGGGSDVLSGQDGADSIGARDGSIDLVRCGDGADTVTADRRDLVSRTCETVS